MAEDKKPDRPPITGVSDSDYAEMFSGAAVHSNRIFSTMTPEGMRLAFMEQHPDKVNPQFRTAVFLPLSSAMSLRDLLVRQLEKFTASAIPNVTEQQAADIDKLIADYLAKQAKPDGGS